MLISDYIRRSKWGLVILPATALAVFIYWWLDRRTPGGLTGGSTVGLWYGLTGFVCMVFVGVMLTLQRRRQALAKPGPRRSWWLKGHVWLSLLSAVLILCHSGLRFGGTLESVLMLMFGLTLLTGIFGLVLQSWLPSVIAKRCPQEIPLGQLDQVCQVWRNEADGLTEKICDRIGIAVGEEFRTIYHSCLRRYLRPGYTWTLALADPFAKADARWSRLWTSLQITDASVQQELQKNRESLRMIGQQRRQLAKQQWLHWWLHRWLLLHVPFSVALLLLGAVHAVMSLYY